MQENILNAFAEQAKSLYAPLAKFNTAVVANVEKLTEFQLNAIKSYAEIGLDQLKKATDVKDAETLRTFTAAQAETASALNKKIMDDAKALSDMAMEFKSQVESLIEDARTTATTAASSAAKPAAKTASKTTA